MISLIGESRRGKALITENTSVVASDKGLGRV